ncbi:ankyrin repeat and SAM domain-containing protein 3-like isoform X1 [Mytilus edulis]|uniref:ankyrin repeat and SAM domain-containing protein 3-like isoform X1 n=2 Tax=Mytilus edulis TaxID=6550 RepID=UPI0039EE6538
MTTTDAQFEASDESSENELLERSLSVWHGWDVKDESSIPLDLHTASSIGHYDSVKSFISRKVDLDKKNRGGWTPLMYACYIGHDNIVNLLLEASVGVNEQNNKGQTPLMLAASCGNESVAYFVYQQGGDLEARDRKGWTALFHATYAGHQNVVKFLLEQGAHINAVEPIHGLTPFMEAAAEGHEKIVQLFLQHRAHINAKSFKNETARSLAMVYNHVAIVNLIDNAMRPGVSLRSEPGLDGDLSSSDDNLPDRRRRQSKRSNNKGGPSIRDGPEAIARLIDRSRKPPTSTGDTCVPKGYVTFPPPAEETTPQLSYRDVTSPINMQDYALDSSGGRDSCDNDPDDDGNAFSKTGALTIKSSSGSSGGLMSALGLSRDNSVDSDDYQPHSSISSHDGSIGGAMGNLSLGGSTGSLNGSALSPASSINFDLQQSKDVRTTNVSQDNSAYKMTPSDILANQGKTTLDNRGNVKPRDIGINYSNQNVVNNGATIDDYNKKGFPNIGADFGAQLGQLFPQNPAVRSDQPFFKQQEGNNTDHPEDLHTLLEQLSLTKYLPVFEEQEINLEVFLSLTDNDLKEIGIQLFGPRKKLTNAIARWHSQAPMAISNQLEQAYADRLEGQLQEMAVQLHKAYEQVETVKAQVLQEQQIRSVTETCLTEERAVWHHVQRLIVDTRKKCEEMKESLRKLKHIQCDIKAKLLPDWRDDKKSQQIVQGDINSSDQSAIRDNFSLDDRTRTSTNDRANTELLIKKTEQYTKELQKSISSVTMTTDRLLGGTSQNREGGYT